MEKNNLFNQRIRLRHLRAFVAIAQQGTLGRAAAILNLSQPALSKTLNELEQLIGVRLFERGRLGARPTPEGEQFVSHALKVLDALHHAGQSLCRQKEDRSDVLRVGAIPAAALGVLPAAIGSFHQQCSAMTLHITSMNNTMLLTSMKSGELDLGIGRMSDEELMTGLNYELLFLESLKLVVRPNHPLLNDSVTLDQILEWPVVLLPKGTVPRQNTDALLAYQGYQLPANCIETLSASLSRQLTIEYNYVWFVTSGAVKDDLRQSRLVALPVTPPNIGEPVGILTRVDAPITFGMQALLNAIRKSVQA